MPQQVPASTSRGEAPLDPQLPAFWYPGLVQQLLLTCPATGLSAAATQASGTWSPREGSTRPQQSHVLHMSLASAPARPCQLQPADRNSCGTQTPLKGTWGRDKLGG